MTRRMGKGPNFSAYARDMLAGASGDAPRADDIALRILESAKAGVRDGQSLKDFAFQERRRPPRSAAFAGFALKGGPKAWGRG